MRGTEARWTLTRAAEAPRRDAYGGTPKSGRNAVDARADVNGAHFLAMLAAYWRNEAQPMGRAASKRRTRTWSLLTAALAVVTAFLADAPPASADSAQYGYGNFGSSATGAFVEDSTGVATTSYPIVLPRGRGEVQPLLGLRYAHTGGLSEVGVGWSLGLPVIERRGLAGGPPTFDASDVYELSGARLVKICSVTSPVCTTTQGTSVPLPAWITGAWNVYRPEVDAAYTRVYEKIETPSSRTWRVEYRSGELLEFGAPTIAPQLNVEFTGGCDASLLGMNFRWKLVRQADPYASGRPANFIAYSWRHRVIVPNDVSLLDDIFYTPPSSGPGTTSAAFAHHIHLTYSQWFDRNTIHSHAQPWLRTPEYSVKTIDVSSKTGGSGRSQVRRYYLDYQSIMSRPHLVGVRLEGMCSVQEEPGGTSNYPELSLPAGPNCPAFGTGTKYQYTGDLDFGRIDNYNRDPHLISFRKTAPDGAALLAPSPRIQPYSLAIVDVNGDGLADFVQNRAVPAPAASQARLYLNQAGGGYDRSALFRSFGEGIYTDAFEARTGISVFGLWGDTHQPRFLYRGAGANSNGNPVSTYPPPVDPTTASASDGAPLSVMEVGDFGLQAKLFLTKLPPPHTYGDMDGDGTVDVIYLEAQLKGRPPVTRVRFSPRKLDPVLGAVVVPSSREMVTNLVVKDGAASPIYASLADMDGDGVQDYVTTRGPLDGGSWVYIPGRGDGSFGCDMSPLGPPGAQHCVPATASPGATAGLYEVPVAGVREVGPDGELIQDWNAFPFTRAQNIAFHDVNGDGKADIVNVFHRSSETVLEVWINLDGSRFRKTEAIYPDGGAGGWSLDVGGDVQQTRLLFGDMDGDGVDDVVLCGNEQCLFKHFQARHAGLLQQILHDGGATTTFEYYDNIASMEQEQRDSSTSNPWPSEGPWRRHSPGSATVVRRVVTNSNTPAPYNRVITREYAYRDPVYDYWRSRLRGFDRTRVTQDGIATETRYLFDGCLEETSPSDHQVKCPNPESDGARAWNGLPFVVQTVDAVTDVPYSTVVNWYQVGADPADSRSGFAYAATVDTYLYDTSSFVPSPQAPLVYFTPGQKQVDIVLPGGAVHLQRRRQYDGFGNLTLDRDLGRVDSSGQSFERVIRTEYVWEPLVTAQGAIGREYRLTSASTQYETGGAPPLVAGVDGPLRRVLHSYDAFGRYVASTAQVNGTMPLGRYHDDGQATAPAPATAVANGVFVRPVFISYDLFGNVISRVGASGECETTEYDLEFADQPIRTHTWLGAGCSAPEVGIPVQLSFDRGLNALRSVFDLNHIERRFAFDAFGRPTQTWGPRNSATAELQSTITYSDPDASSHWARVQREGSGSSSEDVTWSFADNFGRTVVTFTQADTSAGDGADWIAKPAPLLSNSGLPTVSYRPWFYPGDPATYSISSPGGDEVAIASYDFMSRRTSTYRSADGHFVERRTIHPLSVDTWDAENIQGSGNHLGMYSTLEVDGHGRQVRTYKRTETGTLVSTVDYLSTGELVAIEQHDDVGGPRYKRWTRYDSLGRVIQNAEPNTAVSFGESPATAGGMKSWIYAYDASGRMVGTSDAAGCGKNVTYDLAGRPLTEDYSPCRITQQQHSTPFPSGDGTEVLYRYDAPEPDAGPGFNDPQFMRGRLVSVRDRGAHTRYAYDAAGRQTKVARRIAKPGAPATALVARYASHWFESSVTFDEVGRVSRLQPGADVPLLSGTGLGAIDYHYTRRGVLRNVDGSYGTLLQSQRLAADGLPEELVYGDAEHTTASVVYDPQRRVDTYQLAQAGLALGLVQQAFGYDEVGNVTSILDGRNPDRWVDGAKPVSRRMSFDAQYRLTAINYDHYFDTQTSPFATEEAAGSAAPLPRTVLTFRIGWQNYSYDMLGNVRGISDDANATFDRGLGNVNVGSLDAASAAERKPHQFISAGGQGELGAVIAVHDRGGNLYDLALERDGACSIPLQKCAQRLVYEWDEVGQLVRARRWDYSTLTGEPYSPPTLPTGTASVDLEYKYSQGERVLKAAANAPSAPSYSVTPLAGVRLNHAGFDSVSNDYERSEATETVYLAGYGRALHDATLPGSPAHVFFSFGDHLGSTGLVIDQESGNLVEYVTYQAYGATESDYRPAEWRGFREDYRFTGKEDDVEVGLTYFGARYYSPYLARFISPDPLTIHGVSGDLNPYAYVSGRVFNMTDPLGLQEQDAGAVAGAPAGKDAGVPTTPGNNEPPGSDAPTGGGNGRAGNVSSGTPLVAKTPAAGPPATGLVAAGLQLLAWRGRQAYEQSQLKDRVDWVSKTVSKTYDNSQLKDSVEQPAHIPANTREGFEALQLIEFVLSLGEFAPPSGPAPALAGGGVAVAPAPALVVPVPVGALQATSGPETKGTKATVDEKKAVRDENRAAHGEKLTCVNCGRDDLVDAPRSKGGVPRQPNEAHVDHIIPYAQGGLGVRPNLRVLCPACNKPGVIPR